jgi:hypothetical protein
MKGRTGLKHGLGRLIAALKCKSVGWFQVGQCGATDIIPLCVPTSHVAVADECTKSKKCLDFLTLILNQSCAIVSQALGSKAGGDRLAQGGAAYPVNLGDQKWRHSSSTVLLPLNLGEHSS